MKKEFLQVISKDVLGARLALLHFGSCFRKGCYLIFQIHQFSSVVIIVAKYIA